MRARAPAVAIAYPLPPCQDGATVRTLFELLGSDDALGREDLLRTLRLLAPLLDLCPEAEDAAAQASKLVQRLQDAPLLAALVDWWIDASTPASTPLGMAYNLPEEVPHDLAGALADVRDTRARLPPARWAVQHDAFTASLAKLDDLLDLEHYGSTKLPSERTAWTRLLERLTPAIDALRQGHKAERVEFDETWFGAVLSDEKIKQGSARWREMQKRGAALTEKLDALIRLQHAVEPWHDVARPPRLEQVPGEVIDALGETLAPLLLRSVWPDGDATPSLNQLDEALRSALAEAEAAVTGDQDRLSLLALCQPWLSQHPDAAPQLSAFGERVGALKREIEDLKADLGSVDQVELAELYLSDGNLKETVEAIAAARAMREKKRRRESLERQLKKAREGVGADPDESTAAALSAAEVAMADGRLDEAEEHLRKLGKDLRRAECSRQRETLKDLLGRLQQLGASPPIIADIEGALPGLEGADPRPVRRDQIDRWGDYADQLQAQLDDEADEQLSSAEQRIESCGDELRADKLDDLKERLDDARGHRRDGALVEAVREATGILLDIDRWRAHRWRWEDGESQLVEHLEGFCGAVADFSPVDVRRLYVAFKTKPFVILAGLTGSGKSTIARLFAEAMGATHQNGQLRRVAVRPSWIDQSEVLGYINPTDGRFEPGWLAEVLRQCERDPDRLVFVLLDEMNLAPVEHYLAEMLSAMEEVRGGNRDARVRLYPRSQRPSNAEEWPAELSYPPNLVLIGTVNVDESTRPLSERVLDRANVIQLSLNLTRRHHDDEVGAAPPRPWLVSRTEWRRVCTLRPSDRHHDLLVSVAQILANAGIGVGARAHLELERYIANADGVLSHEEALDFGVLQRIIPKIRGFKRDLATALEELRELLAEEEAHRSLRVLEAWLEVSVSDDEFLDGTDPRVGLVAS